ncbi:MAG: AraC family transcriptional regulator [Planctomycetota bacterium]|jgi:AraC-like DNA-binding protein|nr:AraC family transcriptional regulator [Planctomycetota bacterium]
METPRPYREFNVHRWPAGRCMAAHSHDFLQFIHVLDGVLEVDTGTGWRAMHPGCCHVLPPSHDHALRTSLGHRQFGLNLAPNDDTRGVAAAVLAAIDGPAFIDTQIPDGLLAALTSDGVPGTDAALRLGAALDHYVLTVIDGRDHNASERGHRLLTLLREHRSCDLSVASMARHLDISRAGLQRLCATRFGCGAAHLHQRIRMTHAAELVLGHAKRSLSAIATDCGYSDLFHFSHAFKRAHGLAPSRYRQQFAQREV